MSLIVPSNWIKLIGGLEKRQSFVAIMRENDALNCKEQWR